MSILDRSFKDQLIKRLGMLASDHVGERAAAGAAAHRLLKQHGVSWHDVIDPPRISSQDWEPVQGQAQPHPQPPEWLDDYFLARRHLECCSAWERNFLGSISVTTRLSPKQRLVLVKIADAIRAMGLP